jgi:hypothetical protein
MALVNTQHARGLVGLLPSASWDCFPGSDWHQLLPPSPPPEPGERVTVLEKSTAKASPLQLLAGGATADAGSLLKALQVGRRGCYSGALHFWNKDFDVWLPNKDQMSRHCMSDRTNCILSVSVSFWYHAGTQDC